MMKMYRRLPREVQIATLSNLCELGAKFQTEAKAPEVAQPRPNNRARQTIIDPPGMPVRPRANGWDSLTFDEYVGSLRVQPNNGLYASSADHIRLATYQRASGEE